MHHLLRCTIQRNLTWKGEGGKGDAKSSFHFLQYFLQGNKLQLAAAHPNEAALTCTASARSVTSVSVLVSSDRLSRWQSRATVYVRPLYVFNSKHWGRRHWNCDDWVSCIISVSAVKRHQCHVAIAASQYRAESARRRLSAVARSVTNTDMAASGALTHWVKIMPFEIRPPHENHPAHSQPHPLRLTFRDPTTDWDTEPDKQMTFFPRTIPDYSETAIPKKPTTATTPHSEYRFLAPSSKLCQIWLRRHWRLGHSLKEGLTLVVNQCLEFSPTPQWLPLRDQGLLPARSQSG